MKKTPLKRKTALRSKTGLKSKVGLKKTKIKKVTKPRTKALALWGKIVRRRDGRCLVCGSAGRLNAHHLIRKGIAEFALDFNNGVTLCAEHHTFSDVFSAHGTPWKFDPWLEQRRPSIWRWWRNNRYSLKTTHGTDWQAEHRRMKKIWKEGWE